MCRKLMHLVSVALLLCVTAGVQAELTGVLNPSFEDDWTGWHHRTLYTRTSTEGGKFAETPYGSNWAELGNGSWFYQQIGTWEEGMKLEVSFLIGKKTAVDLQGLYVSLWIGGNPSLAANSGTRTPTTLESAVGATQIVISDLIVPPLADGETSEHTLELSSGTGYTYGEPLWLLVQNRATGGRTCVDNVTVKTSAKTSATLQLAWPSPNGVVDVPCDTYLQWTVVPDYSPSHYDVYFGTEPNELNPNFDMELIYAGTDTSFDPDKPGTTDPDLDFGTTYYWRVDAIDPNTGGPFPDGDSVWRFTTEPVGYAIENITATASSASAGDFGPEKTIDGSGLDENDLHSTEATDMWLSGDEPQGAWIQYEFDEVYKLHEMWVWNSNQVFEGLFGFGFRDVVVEYSTDGAEWTALADVPEFARAPGTPGYAHDTTVDFGGAVAKYVKLTASSNWGGILAQYSLSEVRFFHIPLTAREPSPDSGAVDAAVDATLTWRAGREAGTHDVYLSTDEQAVIDGTAPAVAVADASYIPPELDLSGTYYWRIDEVNDAEVPTTWQGDVWDFATQEFIIVEDFESYNDNDDLADPESHRIFESWPDGYLTPTTNGAIIGNEAPPYAEPNIVHVGTQAMPMFYSNTGGPTFSEATRTFADPQDWTAHGVTTLVLWFRGTTGNTGQMYVKINGSRIPYDGMGGIALEGWIPWGIDLTSSGLNLQSVGSLTIGVDGVGTSGILYFDDIRLYASAPEPLNEWTITADSDDAEEDVGGHDSFEIYLTSTDLELMHDNNPADPLDEQVVGLRFVGLPIPRGATITEAWVRFDADDVGPEHVGNAYILIDGELNPAPVTFENTPNNITGRPRTAAQVSWTSEPWPVADGAHQKARTPDISSIIQELVNQDGWAGSALVLIFSQDPATPSVGYRECESFTDNATINIDRRPTLHISYE